MKIVDINDKLFKEYDLRGIIGDDLTPDVAYTFGLGFGSYVQNKGYDKVLVGHDNRLSSNYLEKNLIQGLLETGVDVIKLGLITTPMLNCARKILNLDASIMITASHNPKEYNGFKISFDNIGCAYGSKIREVRDFIKLGNFRSGQGKLYKYDIKDEYLNAIKNSISINKKLKVVIDCGNGTASIIVRDIMNLFDIEVEYLYCDSDGTFPNHHPDPNVEEYMTDLKRKVKTMDYDLGIGIDGDGDRVVVIDNNGNYVTTDYYLILMSKYLKPDKLLFDVKTSRILKEEIATCGIQPVIYKTGASLMNAKMQEDNFIFGGEYSGHIYYRDKWFGFDDGIYSGLRFMEMLANTNKSVSDLLNPLKKYPSHYFNYSLEDEKKELIVDGIKKYAEEKGYSIVDIDGVRCEFDDGFALVRASNTTPCLTLRFEADSESRLKEIQDEFVNKLDELKKSS